VKRLLVTTDLGTFKAYTLEEDRFSTSPRMELLDSFEMGAGHDRLREKTSDREGQFGKGSTANRDFGEGGAGERHNIHLEEHRRGMKQIAERMSKLLADGEFEGCLLAAPSEIHHQILDLLPERVRAMVEKVVPHNLVNAPREELLRQFLGEKLNV
jgi:hypothetical protein